MLGSERDPKLGTFQFTPYAAGAKVYNQVSSAPTMGPVDKTGYRDRDRRLAARRNAMLKRMQSMNEGAYARPNFLRFD